MLIYPQKEKFCRGTGQGNRIVNINPQKKFPLRKNVRKQESKMKNVIVYASVHHGNTKKIADAIANEYEVDLVDATKVKEKDLSEYDLIGFASGVYGFNLHRSIIDFAAENLPANKRIFIITTSAMNKDFSRSIMRAIENRGAEVVGKFSCQGYNTFGPFKLVGGTGKGHPDEKDISEAVAFYKRISESVY